MKSIEFVLAITFLIGLQSCTSTPKTNYKNGSQAIENHENKMRRLASVGGESGKNSYMAFVPVRAGSFKMGSPLSEENRNSDENQHNVKLTQDFEIGATEVTQLQWTMVMGYNPSFFQTQSDCPNSFEPTKKVCADYPVEGVSWDGIQLFLTAYNKNANDGYIYRLPTEAEWEYAARSGTETAFSFGNNVSDLTNYGWYWDNSNGHTNGVALKKPNSWGIYDMHGNVWEFVQDFYFDPLSDSTDPVAMKSSKLHQYVKRGGSWGLNANYLRSAIRADVSSGSSSEYLGFRLVRTPKK